MSLYAMLRYLTYCIWSERANIIQGNSFSIFWRTFISLRVRIGSKTYA